MEKTPERDLLADLVLLNVEHKFSDEENTENGNLLAKAVQDKLAEEAKKKVAMADFKGRIDRIGADVNLYSGYIANGFCYRDKPCELWLNYETKKREYVLKGTDTVVKTEDFHASDFNYKLKLDAQAKEIEERNQIAEAAGADALGEVIGAKITKFKKEKKEGKPTPKDILPPRYGEGFEEPDEDLEGED